MHLDVKYRYKKFLNQHFFIKMNEHICDKEIGSRNIYIEDDGRQCKDTNTFIYSTSLNSVKQVCNNAGEKIIRDGKVYFRSLQPFPVITCRLKSGVRPPHCEYRGTKSTRYIEIGCDQGWPVHYDTDIVQV
uniref:Ribonuclease like 3 n=1 Tax=Scleropages formosus TaxID=113540 RepID=A0A8C9UY68_SCLFO